MKSPFDNDMFCHVAEAYSRLYDKPYVAQYAPYEGKRLFKKPYGETYFPADGSTPIVTIYAHTKIQHGPEIFAHELAHVAVGPGEGHGKEWEDAFAAIHEEYYKVQEEHFRDLKKNGVL